MKKTILYNFKQNETKFASLFLDNSSSVLRPLDIKIINYFMISDIDNFIIIDMLFKFLKLECKQKDSYSFDIIKFIIKHKNFKNFINFKSDSLSLDSLNALKNDFFNLADQLRFNLFKTESNTNVVCAAFDFIYAVKTNRLHLKRYSKYKGLFLKIQLEAYFKVLQIIFKEEIKSYCNNSWGIFSITYLNICNNVKVVTNSSAFFGSFSHLNCFKLLVFESDKISLNFTFLAYLFKKRQKFNICHNIGNINFSKVFNSACDKLYTFFDNAKNRDNRDENRMEIDRQEAITLINYVGSLLLMYKQFMIKGKVYQLFFKLLYRIIKKFCPQFSNFKNSLRLYFKNFTLNFDKLENFILLLKENLNTIFEIKKESKLRFMLESKKDEVALTAAFVSMESSLRVNEDDVEDYNKIIEFLERRYPNVLENIVTPLKLNYMITSMYKYIMLCLDIPTTIDED